MCQLVRTGQTRTGQIQFYFVWLSQKTVKQFLLQTNSLNSCRICTMQYTLTHMWTFQHRWTLLHPDEILKECRLWPKAQVCIPQHRSVAYLLQQSMCRKPLIAQWSKLSEEQNRDHMLAHSFWKQVKRLHHHCLENKRIHLILKLRFMDIQLGWDFTDKKNKQTPKQTNKQTNKWLWATCHIHLLWYQSAKRLS